MVLVGCGRIAFDPAGDGDAAVGSGSGTGDTCASARRLTVGEPLANQSIDGVANDYGGLCGDGADVVYAFELTRGGMHMITVEASFAGAMSVGTSCPPSGLASCSSLSAGMPSSGGNTFAAGTGYVIIDKTGGAGTTFEIRME